MKIGIFVHKIHQFEPNTGQNTQDCCGFTDCILTQKMKYNCLAHRESKVVQKQADILSVLKKILSNQGMKFLGQIMGVINHSPCCDNAGHSQ